MSKTLIPGIALALAVPALAQEPAAAEKPKAAEARPARLGVIDMARVSAESLLGKSYQAQLDALKNEIDAEGTKKQNDLEKLDTSLKALQADLEKNASVLSPEAQEKKTQEIKKKQRDRQAFVEDGQSELQRMRERAQQQAQLYNNEFQQKIRPHIEAAAKEKGIDLLLDSSVAITFNRAFDISQEVIVKADEAEKAKPKTGAAAGAAAPKPATAPATAPATLPKPTTPPATAPATLPKPAPTPSPTPPPGPSQD
jgi:Skp family chaperone for outer membrane proteins